MGAFVFWYHLMPQAEPQLWRGDTAWLHRGLDKVWSWQARAISLAGEVRSQEGSASQRGLTIALVFPAAGKHTANSHRLSALVTPAGKSYECQAQQTISLTSSDPQKTVTMILSAVHIQPFDIISDFVFSEGRLWEW